MTNPVILVKNSSQLTVELIIEPFAHIYKIGPGLSLNVTLDEHPPGEPVEIEYLPTGITLHSGGFATVISEGKVVPPDFFE
jgi:hypothetical protein